MIYLLKIPLLSIKGAIKNYEVISSDKNIVTFAFLLSAREVNVDGQGILDWRSSIWKIFGFAASDYKICAQNFWF